MLVTLENKIVCGGWTGGARRSLGLDLGSLTWFVLSPHGRWESCRAPALAQLLCAGTVRQLPPAEHGFNRWACAPENKDCLQISFLGINLCWILFVLLLKASVHTNPHKFRLKMRECSLSSLGRRGDKLLPLTFLPRLSENQVAEETELVFRSYALYRYQQEVQERGAEVPVDPEITEVEQEPDR